MIFNSSGFVFQPPAVISRARRVLIKPAAAYPVPYPVSTSPALLGSIIESIRQVSDADIILLEGTPDGRPVLPNYKALGYSYPRVLTMDVKDCVWVEVDNPLPKPIIVPTFWIPNVILSCDYLISLTPLKVVRDTAFMTITNLLGVLPTAKYGDEAPWGLKSLHSLGINNVLTDLYFTLPFDLGIIEAREKLSVKDDPTRGSIEEVGKIFVGEPYEVDAEAAKTLGLRAEYLDLIKEARVGLES